MNKRTAKGRQRSCQDDLYVGALTFKFSGIR